MIGKRFPVARQLPIRRTTTHDRFRWQRRAQKFFAVQ